MSAEEGDPEIDFMRTHSVLNCDELIKLNDDRKSLHHKIIHRLVTREELLKQIEVETNLLDTCQLKIDQEMKQKNTKSVNTEVLNILSNRIYNMYNNMFLLHSIENKSLSDYIELCSYHFQELFIAKCSIILETLMLNYHSDPEVYITAANFEFEVRNNVESTRGILAVGLKYHKNCKKLYLEEFWVEVQYLAMTAGTSLPFAIRKYRNLIERFEGDMEFHFTLLDRAIKLRKITELQCNVVRDMVKKYRHSEFMWQKLAKMYFDGFVYQHETEQLHYDTNYIIGIRNSIKTYEDGLKESLPPKNKHNLWNFYIDHVIEIRKSFRMKNETIRNFMNETMERAFQEAHDNKELSKAEHYVYWAENTIKDRCAILVCAVEVIEDSVELWIQLLSYFVDVDSFDKAIDVFQRGVLSLRRKSTPLWDMMILYLQNTHPESLEQLYQEGVKYPFGDINMIMRPKYLEWCILHYNISVAYEVFNELKTIDPPCKQLYTIIISYLKAKSSEANKIVTIRKLYNEACDLFGKNDIS